MKLILPADPEGYTPLHLACLGFKMDTAALLLQNGADPNCQSRTGSLPLHYLARHHFTENETAEFITAYMEGLRTQVFREMNLIGCISVTPYGESRRGHQSSKQTR